MNNINMNQIPADSNHPYSTPLKQEEPDDWFSDKPVPVYNFGNRLTHLPTGNLFEIVGVAWLPFKKGHSWWYCAFGEESVRGVWHVEEDMAIYWRKSDDQDSF